MAKLTEYKVDLNGIEHTMLLDQEDAERYKKAGLIGDDKRGKAEAEEPRTKAGPTPSNK